MAWLRRSLMLGLVAFAAIAVVFTPLSQSDSAIALSNNQPLIAYSLDFGLDRARADKTIDHYGEPVRDVVEQALRNNVNHPDSKETAENSYKRKSFMNDVLPERHSVGKTFSSDDFSSMRKTKNPKDVLKK